MKYPTLHKIIVVTSLILTGAVKSQFLPGNIIALQVGDGVNTFTNTGNALFLRSFSPQGSPAYSLALPTTGTTAIVLAGSSTTEGFITASPDRTHLVVPGYNKSLPNSTNLPASSASSVNRLIAQVDAMGNYSVAAISASYFSTGNIRGAACNNTGDYWGAGSNQGTPYFGVSSNPALIQNTKTNTRAIVVHNGQLYFSTQSSAGTQTAIGIYAVGNGTPLTSAQQVSPVIVLPIGSQPEQFIFSPNTLTCYIADSRSGLGSGGLQKWVLGTGGWSHVYTIPTGTAVAGAFGVTASFTGTVPMIYVTSSEASNTKLLAITDWGTSATSTLLAQAGSNISWRGLTMAPCQTPSVTSVTGNTLLCQGEPLMLQASATGDPANAYAWSGQGVIVGQSTSNPTISNVSTGSYVVTTANACGTASAAISVSVKPIPSVQAMASSTGVCNGSTLVLYGSGASSYNWSGGVSDGIPFVPAQSMVYTVTGMQAGCIAQNTVAVLVYTMSLQAPSVALCATQQATLIASGASQYFWQPGGTGSVQVTSPSVTTQYTVTGISLHGCVASVTTQVLVTPLPILTVNQGSACAGDNFTVVASGAGLYVWSNGVTTPTMVISHPVAASIQLTVTGTLPGCPGTSTATTTVNFLPLPSLMVTGQTVSCNGAPIILNCTGADSYTWSLGVNTPSVSFIPQTAMVLTVSGTAGMCTSSRFFSIEVDQSPLPLAKVAPNPVCVNETLTLTVRKAAAYLWENGAVDSTIYLTADTVTHFTVTAFSPHGCEVVSTLTWTVNACTQTEELVLQPIRLTPQGELFSPATQKLQIVQLTGSVVYEKDMGLANTVQLPHLPDGFYLLVGVSNEDKIIKRLICLNSLYYISAY